MKEMFQIQLGEHDLPAHFTSGQRHIINSIRERKPSENLPDFIDEVTSGFPLADGEHPSLAILRQLAANEQKLDEASPAESTYSRPKNHNPRHLAESTADRPSAIVVRRSGVKSHRANPWDVSREDGQLPTWSDTPLRGITVLASEELPFKGADRRTLRILHALEAKDADARLREAGVAALRTSYAEFSKPTLGKLQESLAAGRAKTAAAEKNKSTTSIRRVLGHLAARLHN